MATTSQPAPATTALALVAAAVKSVATVGACASVGVYAHRQGVLDSKAQKLLDKLVASIFLPCLIMGKVTPNMNLEELLVTWPMAVMCLLMVAYGLVVGATLSRTLKVSYPDAFPHYKGLVMVALAFPNSFSVPLTLLLAVGDHPALIDHSSEGGELLRSRVSMLFLMSYAVWVFARWSIGYPILSGAITFAEWRTKVLNPPVVACAAATAFGMLWSVASSTGYVPKGAALTALAPFTVALDYAGRCSVPCILLALGARLDQAVADIRRLAANTACGGGVAVPPEHIPKRVAHPGKEAAEPAPELVGLQQGDEEPEAAVERPRPNGAGEGEGEHGLGGPSLPLCVYPLVVLLRQGLGTLVCAVLACGLLRGLCGVRDRVVLMVAMLQGAGPPMINISVMAGLSGNAEKETSKLLLVTYGASVFTWTASISFFLALLA